MQFPGTPIKVCPGYRGTAFGYNTGCALVLDTISKFLCSTTCLSRIIEIYDSSKDDAEYQKKTLSEFQYKSVIANYGLKKTYIVYGIEFTKTPFTMTFLAGTGTKMTIAEYFQKTYQIKLTDKDQPLLIIKINGKEAYLPPEVCLIDGVPENMR